MFVVQVPNTPQGPEASLSHVYHLPDRLAIESERHERGFPRIIWITKLESQFAVFVGDGVEVLWRPITRGECCRQARPEGHFERQLARITVAVLLSDYDWRIQFRIQLCCVYTATWCAALMHGDSRRKWREAWLHYVFT